MSLEKISLLESKIEQLQAQKKQIIAKQKADNRKRDSRKKVLLGVVMEKLISDNKIDQSRLKNLLITSLKAKDLKFLSELDDFKDLNLNSSNQHNHSQNSTDDSGNRRY